MSSYLLTIIYDYGETDTLPVVTDSVERDSFASCLSELDYMTGDGKHIISVSILQLPEGAQ